MLPNLRSPLDWNWFDGVRFWLAGKILGKRLWQEWRAWIKRNPEWS